MAHMEKIKLGISACLLGENVRYDGVHKLDSFLKDTLGKHVNMFLFVLKLNAASVLPENRCAWRAILILPLLITTHTEQDMTKLHAEVGT